MKTITQGTDKQIAWANEIRETQLPRIDMDLKRLVSKLDVSSEKYAFWMGCREDVNNIDSAKFWIDWRFDSGQKTLRAAAKIAGRVYVR